MSRVAVKAAAVAAIVAVVLAAVGFLVRWDQGSSPGRKTKPNVLLITVDTLRADHMSLYGYKRKTTANIDRWFGRGRVFERAYSAEASTTPSVVSILTGLLPQRHRVRLHFQKIPSSIITMADRLRKVGYETAAVVSNLVLTDEACGLGSRFDYYDDYVDEKELYRPVFERRASRTTDAAIKWLKKSRAADKPHLLWVHYIDPHGPYHPPKDRPVDFTHEGQRVLSEEQLPPYQREPGVRDGLEYVDLYDEEIAYADREIGRLLEEYDSLGLARNALVIFTADHGETMMEFEQWFAHGYHVYEPIIHVPLAIFGAGISLGRVKTPVSLVDVLPTVMGTLGLPLPDGLDGSSLAHEIQSRPLFAEATYYPGPQWRCAIQGDRKWMIGVKKNKAIIDKSVYEVGKEASRDLHDKWDDRDPVAKSLVGLVYNDPDPAGFPRRYEKGLRRYAPKVAPDVDAETLNKLRALGYVK